MEEHRSHETLNLRPVVIDLMKRFDENFQNFEGQLNKVRDSRVSQYRNKIYEDVDEFFSKIHEITDIMHK